MVLEKTLQSPLDCKDQASQSILKEINTDGRTDAEADAQILWPPDAKSWLIRKDPDAGKDWRQKKGTKEDEMIGWHYQLNGHEFEQVLADGDGQGSLACCSPWGHKELDKTERLNNNNNHFPQTCHPSLPGKDCGYQQCLCLVHILAKSHLQAGAVLRP